MAYTYPPTPAYLTTGALAAGTINGAIVAAGGAFTLYRLVSWSVILNTNVGAPVVVAGFIDLGGGTIFRFGMTTASIRECRDTLPEPGMVGPLNTAINYSLTSTVAGGTALFTVMYYPDTV